MEHKKDALLTRRRFFYRQLRYIGISFIILGVSIGAGMAGYHWLGGLGWLDSFLNASMILTGMGPVDKMDTDAGKLFASVYAIFSGVAFLSFIGVLFTPAYHRFMHRFHLDVD